MPRKFLGEKIDRNTDFLRPSSLTLTADDLKVIPDFKYDDDDAVLSGNKAGKRLSRKFGGTMRLKQRLESVPELFLHDFRKRRGQKLQERNNDEQISRTKLPPHLSGLRRPNGLPARKPLRTITEVLPPVTSYNNSIEENEDDLYYVEKKDPKEHVVETNHKEMRPLDKPLIEKVENVYLEPLIFPVQVSEPVNQMSIPMEELQKYGKSDSEILFDEIISAYEPHMETTGDVSNVLNSEILSVLDRVSNAPKKNWNLMAPKVISAEAIEENKRLSINSIASSGRTPESTRNSRFCENLSSPEYSTAASVSERWSSGDEFSDVASSNPNSHAISHDGSYTTALGSIPSLAGSVDNLDILDQKDILSPTVLNEIITVKPVPQNTVETMHVTKIVIKPQLFLDWESEEEDDPIDALSRQVDNIEIASVYSGSSSVYSDHFAT